MDFSNMAITKLPNGYLTIVTGVWACLMVAMVEGAEPQRLTYDGRIKMGPTFLDDEELIFVDLAKPELTSILRMNLRDGTIEPLHTDAKSQELEPAFSDDGVYCVFLRARGALSVELVIRNEREKTEAIVPPANGFCGFRTPAFFRHGKRVVFSYAEDGRQDIFSVNLQGEDRQQHTQNNGMNYWPSFSPSDEQLLFGSTRDGNYEIYRMKPDGSEVVRLTNHPFQDVRPQYSPDGKRIAFTSHRDGNFEIYLMDTNGDNLQRVTNHPERDDFPTWHPDGRHLVMISERQGSHDLYMVEVD